MKNVLLAGVAALAIVGSTAVYAQHRPWFHYHARVHPEDRAALTDARIAAVKAGLRLTPDQDRLWPPLEAAVRDFAKLRIDRANARMAASHDDARGPQGLDDPVARLRRRAETMGTTAAALKRIADAADPLYKTLDEGQKRRLALLSGIGDRRGGGWHHRFDERGDRDGGGRFDHRFGRDRDRDDGGDQGRDRGYDHGGSGTPERL